MLHGTWQRLAISTERWAIDQFSPCGGGTSGTADDRPASCGARVPAATASATAKPRLIIYTPTVAPPEFRTEVEALLRNASASRCFAAARFLSADLRPSEDRYPIAPNLMFYRLVEALSGGAAGFPVDCMRLAARSRH